MAAQRDVTVLFCSVGPRAELIECFRAAARALALNLRVLGVDEEPETSAGCRVADARFRVSRADNGGIVPSLLKICRRERVSLVVPVVGEDLIPLSQATARFRAVGTRVVVSSPTVVRLECDKLAGARALAAASILIPDTMSLSEFLSDPDRLGWPVIAKPVAGSSSVGIVRPRRPEALASIEREDYVVQELWHGREYTVNMFFDRQGRMRCAVPHLRLAVRTGEVWKGRTERVAVLRRAALRLAKALPGARGPIGFQAIINDAGRAAVLEINARFGGGYPLTHHAGANFAGWLLEEAAGLPSTANDRWREGVTMLRYDAAVFFDQG
jgi:carbamoyl-phosphate synthase large subunit